MNWLEIIGLLTVTFLAIALISEFLKAYDKTQADIAKSNIEMEQFLKEDKERKEEQAKKEAERLEWEKQHPGLAKQMANERLRVEQSNEEFYAKRKEESKIELEFADKWGEMNREQRLDLLKRLSAFGTPKWVDLYEAAKAQVDSEKHVWHNKKITTFVKAYRTYISRTPAGATQLPLYDAGWINCGDTAFI